MSLKIRFRFDGKCSRHPRYNPKRDGRPVDGRCDGCESLYVIHLYTRIAQKKAQNSTGIVAQVSIGPGERAQGWLRLPNGKALNGFSHCYKRHGTTTLFAALEVATGQVQVGHYPRRRRRQFLDCMNEVVGAHPGQPLHVILDNLNTHKPKRDRWLAKHPHVHFHYTPTYSSWLNLVESWFSILSRQALRNLSCAQARQLREAIDRFVKAYQETAAPFEWTKEVVYASGPKSVTPIYASKY